MPRHESNRPTERIRRLLDDYQVLLGWAQEVNLKIMSHDMEFWKTLPAIPTAVAVAEENVRQTLTHSRVTNTREYMRRARSASEAHPRPVSFRDFVGRQVRAEIADGEVTLIEQVDAAIEEAIVDLLVEPDALTPDDLVGGLGLEKDK